jgi:kynureninase
MKYEASIEFAQRMDQEDPIRSYRDRFHFPQFNGEDILYFGGNSLGLMPKTAKDAVLDELDVWEKMGVTGQHDRWEAYHEQLTDSTARLVGAKPSEVVVMNALTVNLHILLVSFYQPTTARYKIVIEKGAFPSDQYAVESQIKFHGFDPRAAHRHAFARAKNPVW